jgi:transposase-like protein
MLPTPYCPRCHSIVVVKSGHHHGKQRWLCQRCRADTSSTPPIEADDPRKQAAVNLYGHGLSFRSVARLLATSAHSVIRWVVDYVDTTCSKPLARFRRRTCVVSRSKDMVDRSIALFAHLHINGGVDSSFFRLPLASAKI